MRSISACTAAGSIDVLFKRCTEIPSNKLMMMKAADLSRPAITALAGTPPSRPPISLPQLAQIVEWRR